MTGVHEAIAAVLDELPAIGKNQKAPAGMGGYSFRGIDDVINALNALLGKHGAWFAPTVHERIDGSFANKSGNLTWTVKLRVGYSFFHKGGTAITDMAVVWGEAHDTGDKGTQKALTAAEKAMLVQVFAISTQEQADSDSERHEVEEAVPERPVYMSALNTQAFLDRVRGEAGATLGDIDKIVLVATSGRTSDPNLVFADEVTVLRAAFESWANERAQQVTASVEPKPGKGKTVPKVVETVRLDEESGEYVADVKHDGTLV